MTSYLTFKEEVTRMRADAFLLEKEVVFMVKGADDVAFWSFIFNRLLPDKYQILKESRLPVAGSSGKSTLQLQQEKRREMENISDLIEKRNAQSFFKHIKKVAHCFEEEIDFTECLFFEKIEKDIQQTLDI